MVAVKAAPTKAQTSMHSEIHSFINEQSLDEAALKAAMLSATSNNPENVIDNSKVEWEDEDKTDILQLVDSSTGLIDKESADKLKDFLFKQGLLREEGGASLSLFDGDEGVVGSDEEGFDVGDDEEEELENSDYSDLDGEAEEEGGEESGDDDDDAMDQDNDDEQEEEVSVQQLKDLLASGKLSKKEAKEIKEYIKALEAAAAEEDDDEEEPSLEELQALLASGELSAEEKEEIQLYINALTQQEDGEDDEEEASVEELQQLLASGSLSKTERAEVEAFLAELQDNQEQDTNMDATESTDTKSTTNDNNKNSKTPNTTATDAVSQLEELKDKLASSDSASLSKKKTKLLNKQIAKLEAEIQAAAEEAALEDEEEPTVDELKTLLKSGTLSRKETKEVKALISELETQAAATSSDEEGEEDNEPTLEELKALLASGSVPAKEAKELEAFIAEVEAGVDEDEDEEEDGEEPTDEEIKALLESGDLSPEEAAELREYLERQASSAINEVGEEEEEEEEEQEDASSKFSIEELQEAYANGEFEDPEEAAEVKAYLDMMAEKDGESTLSTGEASKKGVVKDGKTFIHNSAKLLEKYHEIRLDSQPGSKLPWIETTTIISATPCPFTSTPGLASDDLKRELAFYTTALESTRAAVAEYKRASVPFHRPLDYFAEMVKTDVHMARVRQSLVDESVSMKKSAEAKALREAKKYGKKVQVEKIKERHAAKRAELEKVQIAKRKNANAEDEQPSIFKRKFGDDFDIEVDGEDEEGGRGGRSSKQQQRGANNGRSNKRAKKDSKFGFGGRKRNIKSNTSDSTNDMSGFSQKKMKFAAAKGAKFGGGGSGSGKPSRPGKARRTNNRNKTRS